MAGIKIPGKFVPGIVDGYVLDSQYIKGGYIVVSTLEERDNLLSDTAVVVEGSLIYVQEDDSLYKYTSDGFAEADINLKNSISELQSNLENEIINRTNSEATITQNLNAEVNNRESSDTTITKNLNDEIDRAERAENLLTQSINIEEASRVAKDNELEISINELQSSLNNEIIDRTAGDTNLNSTINSIQSQLSANISQTQSNLETEITNRANADTTINHNIESINEDIDIITADISRIDLSISDLNAKDTQISISLNNEVSRATAKEGDLENKKFDKAGGTISGDVTFDQDVNIIGDLNITGEATKITTKTLEVQDNYMVVNSTNTPLIDNAGIIIRTGATQDPKNYGIVYNPDNDAVELGLGTYNDLGKFNLVESAGAVATRSNNTNILTGNLLQWEQKGNKLVDSGKNINDFTPSISTNNSIKAKNSIGDYTDLSYSSSNSTNTLIKRDENGRAKINDPIEDNDIANKKFVSDLTTDINNTTKSELQSQIVSVDLKLQEQISSLRGDLTSEITTRGSVDNTLQSNINDLNSKIDNEVSNLNSSIANEVSTLNNTITDEVSTLNNIIASEVSTLNATINNNIPYNIPIVLSINSTGWSKVNISGTGTSYYRKSIDGVDYKLQQDEFCIVYPVGAYQDLIAWYNWGVFGVEIESSEVEGEGGKIYLQTFFNPEEIGGSIQFSFLRMKYNNI